MEPNPYESPRSAVKSGEPVSSRRETLIKRLARAGLALFFLSPILYFAGFAIVSSAKNMRPETARPRAIVGEVVGKSGVATFWAGIQQIGARNPL